MTAQTGNDRPKQGKLTDYCKYQIINVKLKNKFKHWAAFLSHIWYVFVLLVFIIIIIQHTCVPEVKYFVVLMTHADLVSSPFLILKKRNL